MKECPRWRPGIPPPPTAFSTTLPDAFPPATSSTHFHFDPKPGLAYSCGNRVRFVALGRHNKKYGCGMGFRLNDT